MRHILKSSLQMFWSQQNLWWGEKKKKSEAHLSSRPGQLSPQHHWEHQRRPSFLIYSRGEKTRLGVSLNVTVCRAVIMLLLWKSCSKASWFCFCGAKVHCLQRCILGAHPPWLSCVLNHQTPSRDFGLCAKSHPSVSSSFHIRHHYHI